MEITKNSRPENTLIVMRDPTGTPECFDIIHLPVDVDEKDRALTRCINRYCMLQYEGTYVPDNRIEVYEYGMDAHLENRFWQFTTDRESVRNYIDFKEMAPSCELSLRAAFYLFRENGKIDSFQDLTRSCSKSDVRNRRIAEYMNEMKKLDRKGSALRYVESISLNHTGTLYFGEDGVSQICMKNYLQQIANHYFSPENKRLSELRHRQTFGSRLLSDYSSQTKDMFCLHNQVLIERKIVFQDPQAQAGLEGANEIIAMGPNVIDFQNYTKHFKLDISEKNHTICTLLQIAECGINDQVQPPVRYRRAFEEVLHSGRDAPGDRLQKEASEIAGRILKADYGVDFIHDHPELNQRIDRELRDRAVMAKQRQWHD